MIFMSTRDPRTLMYEIQELKNEINLVASRIEGADPVFGEISLRIPSFYPAELGFLRTVSWLYVLYYEGGKVNVDFISGLFSTYGLDPNGNLKEHVSLVQKLRTYMQHNLSLNESHNILIQNSCEGWFKLVCRTPIPGNDDHWKSCLICLLDEALNFLEATRNCIRRIEIDESLDQIVLRWAFVRKRYHPPHEFDKLIEIVATDMGRDKLDAARLRRRYYDKWTKELQLLRGDYEFEVEARKLIEHVLLNEMTDVLPITGADIMREFSIPPGPKVGDYLEKAKKIFSNEGYCCSKETLIQKLSYEIGSEH